MKKRIALVVNSLSGGGAEKTVSNLSRVLSEQYDIDIVVNDTEHIDYPYEGNIISLGLRADRERMKTAYQAYALIRRIQILRQLKKTRNYAAVVSFSEMTNFANVLSGNKYSRTIVSVRNAVKKRRDYNGRLKLVLSVVLPYVCKRADRTVSCSREIAEDLIDHYRLTPSKSIVIYNGLDLELIRKKSEEALEREMSSYSGEKLIASMGRMTYQKGQWHLLRAVKKLCDDGETVQLLVLGDGDLRPALEKQAEQLEISARVWMPGFVENPYKFMSQADVFVMPSLYEGFSNAILEALACGLPVISSDHETGAREILAPNSDYRQKVKDRIDPCDYGILVPVCDGNMDSPLDQYSQGEVLLANAIKMVLADSKLAEHYRQASFARAEQLDIKSICKQWISVIEGR